MLNVDVLPAPLGPRSASTVFCGTPKLTSSTAGVDAPVKVLFTCITRRGSLEFITFSVSDRISSGRSRASPFLDAWVFLADTSRRGSLDPESNHTRNAKSTRMYTIKYVIGPPNFVMTSIAFVERFVLPSHNNENRFTETNDARNWARDNQNSSVHVFTRSSYWTCNGRKYGQCEICLILSPRQSMGRQ